MTRPLCQTCHATGRSGGVRCPTCQGSGLALSRMVDASSYAVTLPSQRNVHKAIQRRVALALMLMIFLVGIGIGSVTSIVLQVHAAAPLPPCAPALPLATAIPLLMKIAPATEVPLVFNLQLLKIKRRRPYGADHHSDW